MQLITNLTGLVSATVLAAALTACAGGAPRKPDAAEDKAVTSQSLEDACLQAQSRGGTPPAGCETYYGTRRSRPLPADMQQDPLLSPPVLPSLGLPGDGPLIRR